MVKPQGADHCRIFASQAFAYEILPNQANPSPDHALRDRCKPFLGLRKTYLRYDMSLDTALITKIVAAVVASVIMAHQRD
jgi:hypothetical protein